MSQLADLQRAITKKRAERGFVTDPTKIHVLLSEEVGEIASEIKTACIRLTSSVASQSSSVASSDEPPIEPPTLHTTASIPPSCWAAPDTNASTSSALVTSATCPQDLGEIERRSFSIACRPSSPWLHVARRHPSSASAIAVALSIPRLPPVTRTTFPSRSRSIGAPF